MSSSSHLELGKHGEDLAARYLKRLGYKLITRNYKLKTGEIDIIALDQRTLVFVEVKTRRSGVYAQPLESVGWHKQQKLRYLANRYLTTHNVPDSEVRFDIISIVESGGRPEIEHLKNAF